MEHCIRRNPVLLFLFSFVFLLYFLTPFSYAVNTITRGELITDGDSLISNDEKFELGFFSPGNSTLRYLGIWYYNINPRTVVWVANRNSPISNQNGTLTISADGNLEISDGNNSRIWSSNASIVSNDTAAILHDDGNFVLSQTGSGDDIDRAFWQSFQNPTDTYLPGMRVRVNSAMGENQAFTSWKSDNDPSIGNYSLGIDPRGSPQIVIWENREKRRWRSGQWNGVIFTGVPNMSNLASYLYGFRLDTPDRNGSLYFNYVPSNTSDLLRFRIGWDGREEQKRWNAGTNLWNVVQRQPVNDCEFYNHCGNFGVCREFKDLKCDCINGFEPRNWEEWNRRNFTGGCRRRTPLKCERNNGSTSGGGGEEDGFRSLRSIKLPDFAEVYENCELECCREKCLNNCSCSGYTHIIGIRCMIWSGDLIDVQEFDRGGNLLHLRLAASELDGTGKVSRTAIITISVLVSFFVIVSLCLLWIFKGKLQASCKNSNISCCKSDEVAIVDMSKNKESSTDLSGPAVIDRNDVDCPDLPMYNFSSIIIATNNFSEENKLGQGGFGPVYKGKLPDGQDIAIKRLSRRSGQGVEEFKNEIILIAKLQHRNLVRLLGCCIEGEEKMLLYEYLLNKSLDFFLFDKAKQALLDWPKRFTIIEGIARGLLYLHRDSRLRIIHRDLKASNILLDEDMNPKISDFGMARMFGVNQNEINTNRIVGTYGYMSPEYAMEGLFSIKSDVYSFGVLLLETVSGRRNTSFRLADFSSLIGYAWHLWNEGRATELIDPSIRESCSEDQVMRCIHVGMLCVQDSAVYRPTMAYVVLLLESESPTLPMPKQPTYASLRSSIDGDFGSDVFHDTVSSNDLTVSNVVGR